MVAVSIFILLLLLLASGFPVAFALGFSGLVGIFVLSGFNGFVVISKVMYDGMGSFVLVAVPLFILMSQIFLVGRIGSKLYDVANVWVRQFPGGLGIATILSAAFFAAISGSSTAVAATIGLIAIPEMLKRGYDPKYTLGLLATSGGLGILIPPSVPMIIYSAVSEESTGELFMAGLLPGLLLAAVYIIYAVVKAKSDKGYTPVAAATWAERIKVTIDGIWALILPVFVIGVIYAGIATPTEAAAVGVVGGLFLGFVIYRTLKLRDIMPILMKSMSVSVMILSIIVGALVFGNVITTTRVPQMVVGIITEYNISAAGFIILTGIMFLLMGMVLEVVSIMLITLPILLPSLQTLGISPIWFAVIMVMNMEIAVQTPPVGLNLFVIEGVAKSLKLKLTYSDVVRGVLPFILLDFCFLIVVMLFPQLSLWIPSLVR